MFGENSGKVVAAVIVNLVAVLFLVVFRLEFQSMAGSPSPFSAFVGHFALLATWFYGLYLVGLVAVLVRRKLG